MKKIKFIIPTIFFLLIIFSSPVYASSGKIHSLSLSTLSVTKNSQETFYWLIFRKFRNAKRNYKKNIIKIINRSKLSLTTSPNKESLLRKILKFYPIL